MAKRTLGDTIRQARKAKGLSLRQLQDASGIEYSYIAYLEQGRFAAPNPRKLLMLAQTLELDIRQTFELAGYLGPAMLPDLIPYLKAKYSLPERLARQVADYVATLQAEQKE